MHNESNLTTIALTRLTRSRSKTKIALHHVLLIVCSLKWKQTQISATYWPSLVFWWRTRDRTGRRSDPRAHVPWMKTDRPRGHRSRTISAWGHGPWTRSGTKQNEKEMKYAERTGRKEMFYLTTHSTHFIYDYMERKGKEMFYLMTQSTHFIYGYMASEEHPGRKEMFYLTTHSTHFIYSYMKRKGKEMFYLMTHSTHFIYGYMERKGNVLFNDALNTFYLWLYGIGRMPRKYDW